MAGLTRWLVLLATPMLLTSCLLVPAKFTSSLDIRADRSFTFTYLGEVQLLKSSKANPLGEEEQPDEGEENWDEEGNGAASLRKIAAQQKATKSKIEENFGDSGDEATQLRRLAGTLASEYGFRSVRYIGNRKLAIDYQISGKLDHTFVFPFNSDGEIIVPFLAIELRGKDRVRIKAPGFASEDSAASIGGMGGIGSDEGSGSGLDGIFTLTTNAQIVSQNQEDGEQSQRDGSKKVIWKAASDTRDAPMAVLKVNPLP